MRKSSPPFLTPQTTFLPPFTFPSVISTADENNLKSFPVFCEQCGLCLSHWTKLSHSGTGFPLLKGSCVSQVNSVKGWDWGWAERQKEEWGGNRLQTETAVTWQALFLSLISMLSPTPPHTHLESQLKSFWYHAQCSDITGQIIEKKMTKCLLPWNNMSHSFSCLTSILFTLLFFDSFIKLFVKKFK